MEKCCDRWLISIHKITPEMMIVYEYLLYRVKIADVSRNRDEMLSDA